MADIKYPVLYEKISAISPISMDQWSGFEALMHHRKFEKNEFILKAGEKASEMAIIVSGAVRFFYITSDGEEFNRAFKFEGDIISAYSSLLTGQASFMSIQALEETQTLSFNFREFNDFTQDKPEWERLGRRIAEEHYIGKEKREYQFLTMSATDRYLETVEQFPDIETRIPQFHLASYLGVTASSLNRIIKGIKKGEK